MGLVGDCVVDVMVTYEDEVPHLAGGLSAHGGCLSKQVYDKKFPHIFDGTGNVTPGTALHRYIQEVLLPSGITLKNRQGEDQYLVIGHEQYVFYREDRRPDRRSPIDTILYNLITKRYEIIDWKSTRVGGTKTEPMKYVKLDPKYKYQCNFYGYLFARAWNLGYWPICRVVYFNKSNWEHTKEYFWRTDDVMAEQSIENIYIVNLVNDTFDLPRDKKEWTELATGRKNFSETSTPYLKECTYCKHQDRCSGDCGKGFEIKGDKVMASSENGRL